jgi:hypothetical protein
MPRPNAKRGKQLAPLRIAHVGDVGNERDLTIRVVAMAWAVKHCGHLLDSKKPTHDFVDLNRDRDFLLEDHKYDIVIVHYIWAGLPLHHTTLTARVTATSAVQSPEKWRERLAGTEASLIFAFGGGTEVALRYIGDIPGYAKKECFEPPPVQFGVWQKGVSHVGSRSD